MIDDSRVGRAGLTERLADRLLRGRQGAAAAPTAQEVMRDPARIAALHRAGLLDTPYDEVIDRLTRIAAKVLEVPVALFSLLDEERQICKSCVGLPEAWVAGRGSPLAYSFCQRVVAAGAPLAIEDARVHPLVRSDPATLRGVIAYAGVPLVTSDGHAIGTLCVIDFQPRKWGTDEVETLVELAAALISKIELRTAAREAQETARTALRVQDALAESEARFRTAFDAAPIGMALLATDGRWIRVNDALCEIVGHPRGELLTRTYHEITHADDVAADVELLDRLLEGEIAVGAREKRYLRQDGREVWTEMNVSLVRDVRGDPFHFILQLQDITARRLEEERLRTLSFRDELTELYNRRAFLAIGAERIRLARRQELGLVLLFADVDGMKWINDTFGHREGDRVLQRTAEILRQTFRESDVLARLGGDEFAVLASAASEADAELLVERFRGHLSAANKSAAERPYELGISVGTLAVDPSRACTIEELLDGADARMYDAKGRRTA